MLYWTPAWLEARRRRCLSFKEVFSTKMGFTRSRARALVASEGPGSLPAHTPARSLSWSCGRGCRAPARAALMFPLACAWPLALFWICASLLFSLARQTGHSRAHPDHRAPEQEFTLVLGPERRPCHHPSPSHPHPSWHPNSTSRNQRTQGHSHSGLSCCHPRSSSYAGLSSPPAAVEGSGLEEAVVLSELPAGSAASCAPCCTATEARAALRNFSVRVFS